MNEPNEETKAAEPSPEDVRRVFSMLGSRKSDRKKATSQANGRKGGMPPRPLETFACTCGRGDAMEGHPTTCPRGLAIYRRKKAGKL